MATLSTYDQRRINELQAAWKAAANPAQKDSLHQQAEAIRAQYGYSGGASGSDYIPTSTSYNPAGDINSMYDAQQRARAAQLEAARNQSLSSLNAEKATIQPQYYTQRNNAATASQIGAKNFAEYMAARGGSTGASAQAEISRQSALQGTIGGLRQQEQAAYDDIARRASDVESDYQTGLSSATSDIDMARLQALIEARQRADDMTYQREQDALSRALQEAQLTGQYNGQDTLARQQYLSDLELARQQFALQEAEAARASSNSGSASKPTLTAAQAMSAYENGVRTPEVLSALQYYYGTSGEGLPQAQPEATFTPSQLVSQIREQASSSGMFDKEFAYQMLKSYANSGAYTDQQIEDMARTLGLSSYTPQSVQKQNKNEEIERMSQALGLSIVR